MSLSMHCHLSHCPTMTVQPSALYVVCDPDMQIAAGRLVLTSLLWHLSVCKTLAVQAMCHRAPALQSSRCTLLDMLYQRKLTVLNTTSYSAAAADLYLHHYSIDCNTACIAVSTVDMSFYRHDLLLPAGSLQSRQCHSYPAQCVAWQNAAHTSLCQLSLCRCHLKSLVSSCQ